MTNKPRVMLISPPLRIVKAGHGCGAKNIHRRAAPLIGIGNMATVLHERGYPVKYFDCVIEGIQETHPFDDQTDFYGCNMEAVTAAIRNFGPDVVGVSCLFTSQFPLAVRVAETVKAHCPDLCVVAGGNHASLNHPTVSQLTYFDAVGMGEADFLLADAMETFDGRRVSFPATGELARVAHLDDLPWLNWDLVPLARYWDEGLPQNPFAKSRKAILYETSRGCPERCIFCSTAQFFGKRFRPKSAKRVVSEIAAAVKEYGVEEVQFSDDNIALQLQRFQDICDGLADLHIHLCLPNGIRLDRHFRDEATIQRLYESMRRAGIYQITFAPEGGKQCMLNDIIRKRMDLGKVKRLVSLAKEYGFRVHAFFILGFPYETQELMQETIRYAERLRCDSYSFSVATPFPPTERWQWCVRDNLILEGVQEADYLLGRSVIRRFDGMTQAQLEQLAELTATRLNRRTDE